MLGSRRAWVIFVVAALGIPYQFFLQSTPSVMVASLTMQFHTGNAGVGLLTSCFFYTYVLGQLPGGLIVDAIGPKRSLLIGMVGCSLGCALFALSPTFGWAVFSRLLMGLSASFFVPAALVTAQGWHPVARFALLAGLAESIGMTGGALGEAGIGQLVNILGWRESMWCCVGLGLLLVGLMWFVVADPRRSAVIGQDRSKQSLLQQFNRLRLSFVAVIAMPKLWVLALFASLTFALLAAFAGLWVVPFMQTVYRLPVEQAAFGCSIMFIGVALFAPLWGGYFGQMEANNRRIMLRLLVLAALMMFTVVIWVPLSLWQMYACLFLLGGFSGVYVLSFALVPMFVPSNLRGAAVGVVNMGCLAIGAPIFQPFIGWCLRQVKLVSGGESGVAAWHHYQHALLPLWVGLILACALIKYLPGLVQDVQDCMALDRG